MIYIHAAAVYNPPPGNALPDLKSELKKITGKSYRRIDRFIQLALIGAHQAAAGYKLDPETAIYMTSGQGDIPVFERVRYQRYFQKMMSKPVDFVNLGGNIAGFYVASHLKLAGANLFLSHKQFTVQMALLLAQSALELKQESAILLGGVDEYSENQELAKKLLGVESSIRLGEGSNWMLIKAEAEGARAALSVYPESFNLPQLKTLIEKLAAESFLAFSRRLPASTIAGLMALRTDLPRFDYELSSAYYETLPLYVLNSFLQETGKDYGTLIHIDGDGDKFMVMQVETLVTSKKGGL